MSIVFWGYCNRLLDAQELLTQGPPNLYSLVPLTQDGTEEESLRQAAAAIETRTDLPPGKQADHLAVLRFLAEAEAVPVAVLQSFLTQEKLMESSLYREIFQQGEAKGRVEGEAQGEAKLLIRLLVVRLGRLVVTPEVRQAILAQAQKDPEVNNLWFDELVATETFEAAQRVIRKIMAV